MSGRTIRYRVLYFLLDPFVGSRVAIGSLSTIDGVAAFVRCALPGGVMLGGAPSALVGFACNRLASNACDARVESLGPCFSLGEPMETPCVDDPRAWLARIGTSNEAIIKPCACERCGGPCEAHAEKGGAA